MSQRIFIGVKVEATPAMLEAVKRIRISAERQNMEVEWAAPRGFHITLSFLGAADSAQVESVRSVLQEVAGRYNAFDTNIRGVGAFTDVHHARVLWFGVRLVTELAHLQAELASELAALGFMLDDREYRPHVTMGKLRKARSVQDAISPFVRKDFAAIRINKLVLYESLMHGHKPVYEPLAEFALQA